MVSGLMGLMYLSGHIDCADEANKALIRSAVALYKKYRRYMPAAVPVYPTGTFDIDNTGVNTLGLLDRTHGLLSLAIWNNSPDAVEFSADLSRYAGANDSPRLADVYPGLPGYAASISGRELKVTLPAGNTALYAAVKLK